MNERRVGALCVMVLTTMGCASSQNDSSPVRVSRPSANTSEMNVADTGSAGQDSIVQLDNPGSPTIHHDPSATAGSGADTLAPGQCARQDVSATRITPTIWLVIDGSGSMVNLLDDSNAMSPSRWDALREALMDPNDGVVKTLEHDVMFGMIMFDGPIPGNIPIALPDGGIAMFSSGPAMTCPRLVDVEPKKDNFAAIDMAYTKDPLGGSTPTDRALQQVIAHLPDTATAGPDQVKQPTIVVLATDGEPNDFCSMSFPPPDVQANVLDAVKQLANNGNKTYVISLAGSDSGLMQFCTQVAQAGDTGKPPYNPSTKDDLIQAFRDIIGPGVACDVHLNGNVKMGKECMGTVQINGVDLPCDDDNGWRLKDESTITITGTACDSFKTDEQAVLHADFPCEIFQLN